MKESFLPISHFGGLPCPQSHVQLLVEVGCNGLPIVECNGLKGLLGKDNGSGGLHFQRNLSIELSKPPLLYLFPWVFQVV